ncbi:aspartate aminotransferase cytoplasmic [Clonorchis sinensis]|uniref:aspartate transaminase n=1 Tax=Clonorchis sinensis TaxID=79923 RepID=G7YS16_CLOSI|nr:aspartate aminotransferase cytoplasmic [Clonorchis sinensis]
MDSQWESTENLHIQTDERVGNLAFITKDAKYTANIKSQLTILVRKTWSNPPQHGGRIVDTILNDPQLCAQWKADVATMANRIKEMRQALYTRLLTLKVPGSWEHIVNQIGMFAYTGLTAAQAEHMRAKHHVYLLNDGRINICGLTTNNVDYVANAIYETLMAIPQ